MATTKISALTASNSIDAANDYLPIVQSGVTKKINRNTLTGLSSAPLGLTDTQSPQNKTFDNTNTLTIKDGSFTLNNTADTTKVGVFSLANVTTGTTRTYTLPNASVTLASLTGIETFTNKTLTSPTITGGTIDNSTITVDSISGHSVATTVTVANLQISNGVLNSANAVTSTSIAVGAIQPQALVTGTGTGWAWTSFTPSWTNLTVGNATQSANYTQIGKLVQGEVLVTLGTTSSVASNPQFNVPVAANSFYNNGSTNYTIGQGWLNAAGGSYLGVAYFPGVNTAIRIGYDAAGSLGAATAALPAVWASGNIIYLRFSYQAT